MRTIERSRRARVASVAHHASPFLRVIRLNQNLWKRILSTVKIFPFALKENIIHRHSKSEDSSTEFIPHRFKLSTNNHHRHRRQEEAIPHLHIEDNKSKA
jgi:hypothetical protein